MILETRETARGLIVNLSDVLFDIAQARPEARCAREAGAGVGILSSHPGLKIEIEGHTDSVGTDDYNQRLSERRAESVRSYWSARTSSRPMVTSVGFGESRPVATNDTSAGRQQNRRVELIVSGEARHGTGAIEHWERRQVMRTRTLRIASAAIAAALLPGVSWAQDCTPDARRVVDAIYRQVLERNANGEGTTAMSQLNSGATNVRELVRNIAKSNEHRQRFTPGAPEQRGDVCVPASAGPGA